MLLICGCNINTEQDISLFVDTYFRFGIVLRNICHAKVPIVLISFQIRQNEESDGCYEMKDIYIYGGEIGLAPIMYVMRIKILSYLVTGRKNRS